MLNWFKVKKALCFFVIVAFAAGALFGCGGGGGGSTGGGAATTAPAATTTTAAATTTAATTTAAKAEEKPADDPLAEHITFSVAFWDFISRDDDMMAIIEKACNVTIEPRPIGWDNDMEQIKLFAAADDLPDSTATYSVNSDINRFYSWIDQGLVRSIPYAMTSKYPALKQLTDTSDAVKAIAELKGGEYWFIPRLDSPKGLHKASQSCIYYRKDWLANVGIANIPQTLDECYDMWRAFTYDDPDGNGKKDTFGLATPKGVPTLVTSFGTDPGQWYKEGDKWIPGYYSDAMIEPLEYVQKLYREGALDPEYQFATWHQAVEKITTNTAGSLLRNGDINWVYAHIKTFWGEANPDIADPLEVWDILPPPKKNASTPAVWPAKLDTGANEISSKVDDKKLDRIMYVMEYLLSPEGQALKFYGIEGATYDVVNGKVELRTDPETGEYLKIGVLYPSSAFLNWCEWGFDYVADADMYIGPITAPYRELGLARMKLYDAARDPRAVFTPKLMSTPAKDTLTIDWGNDLMGIIVGDENVSTAFARFKEDCLNKGLQTAIDEVTANMAAIGQ